MATTQAREAASVEETREPLAASPSASVKLWTMEKWGWLPALAWEAVRTVVVVTEPVAQAVFSPTEQLSPVTLSLFVS